MTRRRIDNSTRDQRANKTARFADNAEQREEQELVSARRHFRDHDLAVAVPGADEEAVEGLVEPDFPAIVETEALRPDADHAPAVEQDYGDGDGVEHCFGAQREPLLDCPESVDADCLSY